MRLKDFLFFDSTSTSGTSNECSLPAGAEDLIVQVEGNGNLNVTFKGKIDIDGTYQDLAIISLKGFSVLESITESGNYAIASSGCKYIQAYNGGVAGSVKVLGTISGTNN